MSFNDWVASTRLRELIRPYWLKWFYFRLDKANNPPYFRECWNYSTYPLGNSAPIPDPADDRADILFLPMVDWHTRIQRSQSLARAFAESGHRCFYVNPHLGREFSTPYPFSPRRLVSVLEDRIYELHVHLVAEPVFHHRRLSTLESDAVVQAIRQLLTGCRCKQLVVLASSPLWLDVAARLREDLGCQIIYDCHDLIEGFGNYHPALIEAELEFLRTSDHVIFSSQWLQDHMTRRVPDAFAKCFLVRNGVSFPDFQQAPIREERRENSKRTIGYVGALEHWFASDWVRNAAKRRPEYRFVLVGRPTSPDVQALGSLPNVELVGEVDHRVIPQYLEQFDVAMIPFAVCPLTLATNPIKLYEYFALGLPVVSSRLPEVESYGRFVYLADNEEDFVNRLDLAAQESAPDLRDERRAVARSESWQSRSQLILERLGSVEGGRGESGRIRRGSEFPNAG